KELEELAEKMIGLSAPENQVEIRNAMANRRAAMKMPPPHVDSVTGAYSSRFLDDVLTWETARADLYDYPLTMLLIDVDNFKLVNDTYGRVVGDRVLRSDAALLRSSVREADVVFRSGGDEFSVLLPFTPLSDAVQVRDRILRRVRTLDLLPGRPGRVTVT